MGDEFEENVDEDITPAEDMSDVEDFTPAEGREEADEAELDDEAEPEVEEIPEDEEDFTPAEGLEEADEAEPEVEEIPEDEEDFTPAEGLEEADEAEPEVEEIPEDEEDFTLAEGLGEADEAEPEVEEIPEDEEDFIPAEGLEEADETEPEFEETEEVEETEEAEETEDTEETTEAVENAEDMSEETHDEEMSVETYEDTDSEEGASVKVLKPDGDTSTHIPDYDERISDLDKGIKNAKQPYMDEVNEIKDEYDDIIDDPKMSTEGKISSLEEEKSRLTSLKEQWQDESSEWYEERERLQQLREQENRADVHEGEGVEEVSDMSDTKLNGFSDRIKKMFQESDDDAIGMSDSVDMSDTVERNRDTDDLRINARSPKSIEGMDAAEPVVDVVPLDKTKQTINLVELDDGTEQRVFDHPDNLLNELPFSQGINELDKEGTCALANLGSWLEIGGSRNTENDIVKYASSHMDMYGDALCSESGGVLPQNIPTIWREFGVDAYLDESRNLESIAEAVESGRAVSVGVNAGKLYETDNLEAIDLNDCYGDGGANHAVGVVSCARDSLTGNITHFYINDTGRSLERDACRKVGAGDFLQALNVKRGVAIISKKPIW